MDPSKPPKQSRISPWVLGIFVLISLTVLILLQTSNLWKEFSVDTASDTLLLYALSSLNFIAFVIFGFIFLRSIIKLARERRTLQLGSRIKTRLLLYFVAISLLPIIAMAGFSYLFMNRALERWFTQIPENVVREARGVQLKSTADQHERLQETARMLALSLDGQNLGSAELDKLASAGDLTRIEILSKDNQLLAASKAVLNPEQQSIMAAEIAAIRDGNFTNPLLADGIGIDAASASLSDGRTLVIVPNLGSAQSVSQMVDNSLAEFDRLKEKQITVRQVGFLTLGVLTFLLIFASTWTAFYIARGLTVPIKALAEGADEIAQGNFFHRVDTFAEDELALLVASFNQMSSKLEENSAELRERKRYIETVLESLPIGVISLDHAGRVGTINKSAVKMLRLENGDFTGIELNKIVGEEDLEIVERVVSRAKRIGHASEQASLRVEHNGGHGAEPTLPVALSATALPEEHGAVLLLEDLSELIAAQRASAWQEVARRMAHEIKNPLTPIQLSAERIAKRFAQAKISGENGGREVSGENGQLGKMVDESTETILREVHSLKSMVDEFSRFARLPDAKLESGDLNDIVRQVAALYEDRLESVKIELRLADDLPETQIDGEQIKRVFVNLIDNAVEAFGEPSEDAKVVVRTRHDSARDIVVAEVADNGKGIDPADFQKLFQPYFSTKGRGTGLGLAIVHRIILEHGGKIYAAANQPNGAKFVIEIPLAV